jgi:hypothetical protein
MSAAEVLVHAASTAFDRPTTEELKRASREVMKDPVAPAVSLMVAAKHLLGNGFTIWEPETLWKELDPPVVNRGKLAAAIALDLMPSFYWDYRVFGNTCLALNDEITLPDQIPQPMPWQMAWGIFEAELIFALTTKEAITPTFDDEPTAYCGLHLFEMGWVCTPENMAFCEEELLKHLSDEARQLHEIVKKRTTSSSDEAAKIQLARLEDCSLYVVNRSTAVAEYLKKL